jgi:hypothetical protein
MVLTWNSQITPTMIASIGWRTYLVFAIFNMAFIPIIYLFYPETAGRSLEEIDVVFARAFVDKKSPVAVAKTMKKMTVRELELEELRLRGENGPQEDEEKMDRAMAMMAMREVDSQEDRRAF